MSYAGEAVCEETFKSKNTPCTNKAYFIKDGKHVCGVHNKGGKFVRKMAENPNKELNYTRELAARTIEIEAVAAINKANGDLGNVTVSKMYMMKNPEYHTGYLNVFPNYKHQNRRDGFGCARLSPKSLGPVIHNMPGLPDAASIENYHQFSKFWKFELDDDGNILEKYKLVRIKGYTSEPMRHKYDKKILEKYNNNVNIPEFSMYYDKDGNEHRYSYIESRYFYCHFYELLAKAEPDFAKLVKMKNAGYNLNICGFDGYEPNKNDLMENYLDGSRPFGHELVLYTLLIEDDPKKYPWNVYYQKHYSIYENVI